MDISGSHPLSVRGERCFLLLLDEATRTMSDVLGAIRTFLSQTEAQTGLKVERWHSDNGGEFISNMIANIAKTQGIVHEPTAPYNPEQNESAE